MVELELLGESGRLRTGRIRSLVIAASLACSWSLAGCGSSGTEPCGGPASSCQTTTTSTVQPPVTLAAELNTCTGGATYQGTAVESTPATLNLAAFFNVPTGAIRAGTFRNGLLPAATASGTCDVTGTFSTGSNLNGAVAGTYTSGAGGTFAGVLTTTGPNGCTASTSYSGSMTTDGVINWVAGARTSADTCGQATPLTFTVSATLLNVAPQPPIPTTTTSVTTTSTTTTTIIVSSCTYTLSIGSTIDGYPSGGAFPVAVTAPTGCAWTASSNASWIHVPTSSGSGSGTFTFTADANLGAPRTGTLTIAGQTVTFNQTSQCTYALSTTSVSASAAGGSLDVTVTAGVGCAWTAVSSVSFLHVTAGSSGSGNGTVTFAVDVNTGTNARAGSITVNWSGGSATVTVSQAGASPPPPSFSRCDFNHDGIVDTVDVNILVQAVLNASQDATYDLNRDGAVNVIDVQLETNVSLHVMACPP